MKYEMPTCEIVLLEQCVVTVSTGEMDKKRPYDSPLIPLI